jgi:hypothetical protein
VFTRVAIAVAAATFAALVLGISHTMPRTAMAAPAGFPDLSAFQPVDPALYTGWNARGGGGTFFATPDGIQCALARGPNEPPDAHFSVGCTGPLPGLPDTAPRTPDGCIGVGVASSLSSDLSPYVFHRDGCPVITSRMLNVGQKITTANTTCLVGVDRLTACVDPILNRGFVLQRSGSWTF